MNSRNKHDAHVAQLVERWPSKPEVATNATKALSRESLRDSVIGMVQIPPCAVIKQAFSCGKVNRPLPRVARVFVPAPWFATNHTCTLDWTARDTIRKIAFRIFLGTR